MSAIHLAKNLVFHGHTKYIEIDFHFICECVVQNDTSLHFVSITLQLADLFTKPLPSDRLLFLKSKLMHS